MNEKQILAGYEYARAAFADAGVDTEQAMEQTNRIPLSVNCWQGDDVIGFDGAKTLSGGIAVTGSYRGRAATFQQLTADLEKAYSYIPGVKKLNLHASYAIKSDPERDRDAYTIEDFLPWVAWAKKMNTGLDFNPTYFSHPEMDGDFSLSSFSEKTRQFWIDHGKRVLEIAGHFADQMGQPSVVNFWMPDGYKDTPVDSAVRRRLMTESLDEIFSIDYDPAKVIPAIESKLFGIGAESYTVASHEYALGYALSRGLLYCLDAGHFHPTEVISAKISAVLQFVDRVLLHVSRPVRWDSDHVVTHDDELQRIMDEIVFNGFEERVFIGTDFFDASINRLAAWAIGLRNTRKALLYAALAPVEKMRRAEADGDYTLRLALQEERKNLPAAAVWNYYCLKQDVPQGRDWIDDVKAYEESVLEKRQ